MDLLQTKGTASKNKNWTVSLIAKAFAKPFFELIQAAYTCHRSHFKARDMEFCALSSIKTGTCPEDCAYCPQSGHYNTGLKKEKLRDLDTILAQAKAAQEKGAKRFCMGAAWRGPPEREFDRVLNMVKAVKKMGLETCATLGMLNKAQASALKAAGLDYYNHNLDTSREYYSTIISTRKYEDRLETIAHVAEAGIHVCCGGILGMGETRDDRIRLLWALYKLPVAPKSIPINHLIPIPGTPLAEEKPLDFFEVARMIAVTRIVFPKSKIRLSAGREQMSDEMQAWCFMAGANSIFIGDKLLTAKNPDHAHDLKLLKKLDISPWHNQPEQSDIE